MEQVGTNGVNGTTVTKRGAKEKELRGVKLDRVNLEVMLATARNTGSITIDAAHPPAPSFLVQWLDDYFKSMRKETGVELLTCDICGGFSPESLDSCPFCGDGDDAVEARAELEDNAREDEQVAAKQAPAPKRVAAASRKKRGVDQMNIEDLARKVDEEGATAIATATPTGPVDSKLTEKDLNNAVDRVQKLKGEGAVQIWRLGAELKDIHAKQLWKLRTDDAANKGARYKAFDQFCVAELGMTHGNAFDLMDVAARFSEAQVRALGTSKLALLLKAPESVQATLQEKIEKGASWREVKDEVKKAKELTGTKGIKRNTGRKKMPHGQVQNTAKNPDRITVANLVGKHLIPLYAKVGSKSANPKPAKKLNDDPVGVLEMSNRTKMHFSVVAGKAGDLALKIVVSRDE